MSTGRLGAGDTAIQPTIFDAKADILTATAADTPARLAVGANNTVLTADSAEATGLKWATPATSALVFIKRSTFTAAANSGTSFDNVFTSTYKVYQVVIESLFGSTGSADLYFQWRSGAATDITGYNGYLMSATTTWANTNWNNGSQATIALSLGGAANEGTSAVFWCSHVKTGGNEYSQLFGFSNDTAPAFNVFGGYAGLQDNDGFILTPSTGTFTGTVAIYGLATS
jgi:hypothetical protein